jgi:hypothetical protein
LRAVTFLVASVEEVFTPIPQRVEITAMENWNSHASSTAFDMHISIASCSIRGCKLAGNLDGNFFLINVQQLIIPYIHSLVEERNEENVIPR